MYTDISCNITECIIFQCETLIKLYIKVQKNLQQLNEEKDISYKFAM
jgi:hypothetical protein